MSDKKIKIDVSKIKLKKSSGDVSQEDFIDLKPVNISGENLNCKCTDILEQLLHQKIEQNRVEADKKLKSQNNFRIRSIKNAIQALKDHDEEISSGFQAKEIKGIGKGIADRIDEIIETGTLKELDNVVTGESEAIKSLSTIKGIADKTALNLYHQYGIHDAQELIKIWKSGEYQKMDISITHEQEIGMRYYDDLLLKVPYDEITLVRPIIEPVLKKIDKDLKYEICGSHRRGKPFSGDIDILITHKKIIGIENVKSGQYTFLRDIVNELTQIGFLIDDMLIKPGQLFRGVCKLLNHARQIDFHIVSYDSYPSALLHFTGSKNFNVQMRRVALKKGYTLTEFGLYKVENGKKGHMIPAKSERDIFNTLKVKYLDPKKTQFRQIVCFSKKGKAQPFYARYVIRVAKLKQSDQKLYLLHRILRIA